MNKYFVFHTTDFDSVGDNSNRNYIETNEKTLENNKRKKVSRK